MSLTAQEVLNAVSEYRGVSISDLQSAKRVRATAHARQEAHFIARKVSRLSLPQIGRYIGKRDHTTVLHGLDAVQRRMNDREYARQIDDMICLARESSKLFFKSVRTK